jgi:transcriptional regulator with XRE-family HTH domain
MNAFELARYEAGLTIEQAAAAAKVNGRTIRRLEGGQIRKPSAPTVKALANVYRTTVPALLGLPVLPDPDDDRAAA